MALITNNISGSASNLSQIGITGSVIIANRSPATFPAFPGTDVTFFVSGSTGVADGKSVFGGDLVISGSGQFFGNVLEVTGAINMSGTMHVSGVFRSGYSTFNVNDYTHTEGSVTFAADVYSVITFVDTGLNEITVEDASIFAIGDKVAYVYNAGGNGNQVHITEVTNSDNVTIVTVAAAVSINGSSFNALSNAVTGGDSVLINLSQVNETRTFAHAEGSYTIASGLNSHAEGRKTAATGNHSHAEGVVSLSSGIASHAEGNGTLASGDSSHAEGYGTRAIAAYSHAAGQETIASGSAQTVVGRHNLRDNNFSLFVVGNGTGDSNGLRSDAIRVNAESTQISGSFFQRNSGSSAVGFMGSDTAALPSAKGPDVFFYVSGTVGAKENAVVGTALFGGDVVVSGSLFAEGDTFEVTGSLTVTNGISGSLTKLSTGASYLVAGTNVTITSQSNGQVTIAASGGGAMSLQFLAGTVSSQAPSSSMGSIGMDYLDTTSLPPAPTYTFSAILATTAGTTAYMDLYDYDGIIGGTPNPIAGAVLTGSSTSYTYLTADVTSALSLAGSSGIIEARIWCSPTGSGLNAICKSAKLTIS